jgi:hypothetical protein
MYFYLAKEGVGATRRRVDVVDICFQSKLGKTTWIAHVEVEALVLIVFLDGRAVPLTIEVKLETRALMAGQSSTCDLHHQLTCRRSHATIQMGLHELALKFSQPCLVTNWMEWTERRN